MPLRRVEAPAWPMACGVACFRYLRTLTTTKIGDAGADGEPEDVAASLSPSSGSAAPSPRMALRTP